MAAAICGQIAVELDSMTASSCRDHAPLCRWEYGHRDRAWSSGNLASQRLPPMGLHSAYCKQHSAWVPFCKEDDVLPIPWVQAALEVATAHGFFG
jgi:hypothetical protein